MPEHHDFLHQVTAVARRHGVDAEHVKEVAGGVANRAFILGDDLFLRACRPGYEDDLRNETHVVPAARLVGVLTPEILEYDETQRLLPAPYVVMERVHGAEPTEAPIGLAGELARLHQLERAPSVNADSIRATRGDTPAPQDLGTEAQHGDLRRDDGESRPRRALDLPGVPEDDWGDPWQTVDDLATRGYVDPATASWLTGCFHSLLCRQDQEGGVLGVSCGVSA